MSMDFIDAIHRVRSSPFWQFGAQKQSNKSLLNLSKTNYNTYFITQFIRFNSKGNISISKGDPNQDVLSAHEYALLT